MFGICGRDSDLAFLPELEPEVCSRLLWYHSVMVSEWPCVMLVFCEITSQSTITGPSCECSQNARPPSNNTED